MLQFYFYVKIAFTCFVLDVCNILLVFDQIADHRSFEFILSYVPSAYYVNM